MAELQTLGFSIDIGAERINRLRATYPDLDVRVEVDLAKIPSTLSDADAFVGRGRHVTLLRDAKRLRWVQTLTAGADAVDFDMLEERGIVLTNGSGIHAPNLAEHLLMLMLAFARGLPDLMRAQQRHEWKREGHRSFELAGQTLCIIGLGDIGCALAERAAALGMRITGVRRRILPVPTCVETVGRFDDLDDLLADADHVAICVPLTVKTNQMFDSRRIGMLKPSAYIYNIGRGEVIDQGVLIRALSEGRLAGAGLDVTTPEPLPADSPLWNLDNVIITSHTGGGSPRRMDRFLDLLIENIRRYRDGAPLRNVVDPVEGY